MVPEDLEVVGIQGKVNLMSNRTGKKWTEDEVTYLEEKWGIFTREKIARILKRTVVAVQVKSQRLGLGDPLTHIDGITISQLSNVLGIHYSIFKNWILKYDFPAKRKAVVKEQVLFVSYDDFWKWAKKHKQMIDFSRFNRLEIGPEPEWVATKRKADELKKLHKPRPHNTPWSKDEDSKLRWMLDQYRFTYPEIADEIKRSQGAIKRRILDLGLMARPIRLNNQVKYTKDEENKIIHMLKNGFCFEEIASRLGENRSALGVRGKVERMGYKFKNGVPYKEKEIS